MFIFLLLLGSLCTRLNSVQAFEVMYEGFEQLNSTDFIELQVRVTKINRTTAALNGTIIVKKPITADYKVDVSVFHSAKGNQQFNHYPMKIPATDFCSFTKDYWPDYKKYYDPYVENNFELEECPVIPRRLIVNKHILNAAMFPPFMPTGLWKLYITIKNDADEGGYFYFTMKIYETGYFG